MPQPVGDVGRNSARALDLASASGKLRRQIIDGGEQPRRSTPDGVLFDGRVCTLGCKLDIGCHFGLLNVVSQNLAGT
jgi:hypothetical protein